MSFFTNSSLHIFIVVSAFLLVYLWFMFLNLTPHLMCHKWNHCEIHFEVFLLDSVDIKPNNSASKPDGDILI